jgi:ubiquinone/menaquinone biosynthesis C-methylase UbiE
MVMAVREEPAAVDPEDAMSHPLGFRVSGGARDRTDFPRQRRGAESTSVAHAAYGAEAGHYDARTEIFQGCRERLVAALDIRPGDLVLDVGCGTGLCFDGLRMGVGSSGGVVGIDESVDMARLAKRRVAARGWANVSVLHSSAGRAKIPVVADKALFCAAHDVLQSVEALENIFEHLRPGARVVAGGGKFTSPWFLALNMQVMGLHRPYIRSFAGFARPWAVLAQFLEDLQVSEFALGTGFCAVGRVRADIPRRTPRG